MSVMTHESRWRLLVGAAPVVGVALFGWAAVQGQADMARSPTARAVLAAVAALGTLVAWRTAHQRRATPSVAVARASASADIVTLRGRARALPDAVPLVSPDGELCLWFDQGRAGDQRISLRPFLLVDDSGECIVLPAGADVTGRGLVDAPESRAGERLIRNGDRVQVIGRVASPPSRQGLPLPVISAPGGAASTLRIRIGSDAGEGGVYGLLAVLDCGVLVVASSLVVWSMFGRT